MSENDNEPRAETGKTEPDESDRRTEPADLTTRALTWVILVYALGLTVLYILDLVNQTYIY